MRKQLPRLQIADQMYFVSLLGDFSMLHWGAGSKGRGVLRSLTRMVVAAKRWGEGRQKAGQRWNMRSCEHDKRLQSQEPSPHLKLLRLCPSQSSTFSYNTKPHVILQRETEI